MNVVTIALAGAPNTGKTTLFNALTGSNQRVANFAGATVEKKTGQVEENGQVLFNLLDLPGIYSLDVTTLDEKISRDVLLHKHQQEKVDALILMIDATNLQKGLYLALQLKEIGQKMVIALNMMDEAELRGQELDIQQLSTLLDCPVIPIVAVKEKGLERLKSEVLKLSTNHQPLQSIPENFPLTIRSAEYVRQHFSKVDDIIKKVTLKELKPDSFSARIDHYLLHPFWGLIILAITLITVFQFLFSWSEPFVVAIEWAIAQIASLANSILPDGMLKGLVIDGVINGVGGVLVFVPHVAFLFLFILFLEDVGYLARAAFLLNGWMKKIGLPGKAVIPLLSSHACAIPGIMSARIIENPTQRLITILVTPLTTCSARLPVYTMLIGALIPASAKVGPLHLQGLILFGLYTLGILSAFFVAWAFNQKIGRLDPALLLMELPSYRTPKLKTLLKGITYNTKLFLRKAGTIILALSIGIWILISFPKNEINQVQSSYAGKVGTFISPIFKPQGFDWRISTSLIPSFGAREVMISSLSMVFAIEEENEESPEKLQAAVARNYSTGTLFALIIWFVYAPQCISTFAIMKKETNGWKWPMVMMGYTLALAYGLSALAKLLVDAANV